MADPRRLDAIWTVSGRVVRPLDPNSADIALEDIAHSLANQCRYTGHTSSFYSVAQHSVHVSEWIEVKAPINETTPESLLWGLLHDASEAYLSDLARPIKRAPGAFGEVYAEVEEGLLLAVAEAFSLPWPMPEVIKVADNVLLQAEMRDLMPAQISRRNLDGPDVERQEWEATINPWSPKKAREKFMRRYKELTAP